MTLITIFGLTMGYLTVEEFELLSFFEVLPHQADPEIAWPYNNFSYHVEVGPYTIDFGIAPVYRDLSFTVICHGSELFKFSALSVKDVRYHRYPDREVLEITVSDRETIWFQLRPTVSIIQHFTSGSDNAL